jgi:DNA-directed RNA polymerase subunit F
VPKNSKSILNFFGESDNNENDEKNNKTILNKASLQEQYLILVDKNYACEKIKMKKPIFCTQCKIEKRLFQSEGSYKCIECGETEDVIMESEIPSHADLSNEKQKYPYKKINHLKEKLSQFQSKESIDVPDDICSIIKAELKKKRIKFKDCTPKNIRAILKKYRLTIYYEHLQQIYCKISDSEPITLSRDIEETIINMFQSMQESFHKHRPPNRSNFLSYSYVLNKLFRILGMPKHANYFSLLKSKDKLREQDSIWAKICKDQSWKFYSSF